LAAALTPHKPVGNRFCLGRQGANIPRATISPTTKDIAWAAGFMEGEGCFTHTGGRTAYGSERVQASQVNMEPLERLQALFGGRLIERRNNPRGFGGRGAGVINVWQVNGSRARGVMLTLFPLMSERRRGQILVSLHRNNPTEAPSSLR
jgi:hypothetical protein